ncbi:MAG: hypothetical protein L6416_06545 [Candidatus Omnitrophica bacterium]|nr:hypothetical protein [Candidatus Omnitrophota bacterium]
MINIIQAITIRSRQSEPAPYRARAPATDLYVIDKIKNGKIIIMCYAVNGGNNYD